MQEIEIEPGDDTRWHEFHSIREALPKINIHPELDDKQKNKLVELWNKLVLAQGGDGLDGFVSKITLSDRLKTMEKFNAHKDSKILCVGCGEGREVMYLRNHGYANTEGTTIGMGNAQFAKWAWDLNLIVEDMHFMSRVENEEFDVLMVYQTLEHSWAPFIALLEWRRVLKKNGILIVEIPVMSKEETDDSKRGWHHQIYLSQEQLCYLFIKAKFEVLFKDGTERGEEYKGPITVVGKRV